jgi:hypothetical protein
VPADAKRAKAEAGSLSEVPPAPQDGDGRGGQDAERALRQELEVANAREARLRAENRTLADALEHAEQQLGELPTLREEAEIGRRQRDAAVRLQVLLQSSSWRVTWPLRFFSRELRRVRQRARG